MTTNARPPIELPAAELLGFPCGRLTCRERGALVRDCACAALGTRPQVNHPRYGWYELRRGTWMRVGPGRPKRGALPKGARARILARDGHQCQACGRRDLLEIDHITPVARGGTHADANLRVLCTTCNSRKGATLPTAGAA